MRKLFGCLLLLSLFGLIGCHDKGNKNNPKLGQKPCCQAQPALEISADK